MGYVDNLGRFVTEIEPDPCRKNDKESRLSRAVKRLVHIEQDEVNLKLFLRIFKMKLNESIINENCWFQTKEESAWKIAEMIVRDVTSLTLGATDLPS